MSNEERLAEQVLELLALEDRINVLKVQIRITASIIEGKKLRAERLAIFKRNNHE